MNLVKSSVCTLQKSSFLLNKTKEKDFIKINRDFTKIPIHQIDNRPKYNFTSSQLFAFCKMNLLHWSSLWNKILSTGSVIIGSVGQWVGGRLVGGSVSKWSVVGWSVAGGFNKTHLKSSLNVNMKHFLVDLASITQASRLPISYFSSWNKIRGTEISLNIFKWLFKSSHSLKSTIK